MELLPSLVAKKAYSDIEMALAGLTDYRNTTASFAEGINEIAPIIDTIASNPDHPKEERAYAINRLQMLRYQDERYTDALIDALKVVELAPEDESYWYNLSLIQEKLERYQEAADSALKYVEFCHDPQPHHLKHVREVLTLAGRGQEFENVLAKFR